MHGYNFIQNNINTNRSEFQIKFVEFWFLIDIKNNHDAMGVCLMGCEL